MDPKTENLSKHIKDYMMSLKFILIKHNKDCLHKDSLKWDDQVFNII